MGKYIFLVECPITGEIKHIYQSYEFEVDPIIKKDPEYLRWNKTLSSKKLKPIFTIIDRESAGPDIYLDSYRSIFISWGVELFEKKYLHQKDKSQVLLLERLKDLLLHKNEILDLKSPFNNSKLILFLIADLMEYKGKNRFLDEFILIYILTFTAGIGCNNCIELDFRFLKQIMKSVDEAYDPSFFSHFRQYINYFIEKYEIKDNLFDQVFKKLKIEIPNLNYSLKNISKIFGYNLDVSLFDSTDIFFVFVFKYHLYTKKPHPKILNNHFFYFADGINRNGKTFNFKSCNDKDAILMYSK
ncbi:hypothetical protein [Mangrovivirga cuniculi]|uniref:Uncharacterized protein n=1 Tax=Mangrovivirga cuniculi TaxID=2715131 RepID=A0A4D7K762_9BACT|nr:hypothetical protein [Mangrovivirga cuniculi]QCK15218.1 hypothetical protein DCC35_10910 [Mangrovivirga cuniculi]